MQWNKSSNQFYVSDRRKENILAMTTSENPGAPGDLGHAMFIRHELQNTNIFFLKDPAYMKQMNGIKCLQSTSTTSF